MSIVITGCAGQIGINLARHLLSKGEKIIGVDNFVTGSKSRLKLIENEKNLRMVNAAIHHPEFLEKLRGEDVSCIYHLACPPGVDKLDAIPEEMLLTLTAGTKNVLDLAKEKKVRCLIASSSEVYGDPLEVPQKETYTGNVNPLHKRAIYQEGKRITETLASLYHWKHGVSTKIARIFNCYGPHFSEHDQRAIPAFVRAALANEPITIHGKGDQKRCFCYIEDLIRGFEILMEKGADGEAYNIGNPRLITIKELIDLIIQHTGSTSELVYEKARKEDPVRRQPDIGKIGKLGYSPLVPFEEGLKKTIVEAQR